VTERYPIFLASDDRSDFQEILARYTPLALRKTTLTRIQLENQVERDIERIYSAGSALQGMLSNYAHSVGGDDEFFELTEINTGNFEKQMNRAFRLEGTVKTKNAEAIRLAISAYDHLLDFAHDVGAIDRSGSTRQWSD